MRRPRLYNIGSCIARLPAEKDSGMWPAGRAAAKQAKRDRCPEHPAPAWNASAAAGLAEDTEIERKMHNWVKPATLRAHGIAVRANPCTSWVLLPSQALS